MKVTDYYRVLGLPPAATVEQVKAAYRRRALRYHPDKNSEGDERTAELFKSCSEAFATLVDPDRRSKYDAQLLLGRGPRELLSEVVGEFVGAGHRRRRSGAHLQHTFELALEDCTRTQQRELRILVDDLCHQCDGRGSAADGTECCPDCGGKGDLQRARLLALPRICPRCVGRGVRTVVACPACDGVGMVERTRRVRMTLPPGLRDGHVEVLPGEGAPGLNGGPDGDLHVLVRIRPHSFFRRQGTDLELELPVGIYLATLGGTVLVPTLDGSVQMKLPAGTQSGAVFRLRGKGLPSAIRVGDILVRVMVETPVGLDAAELALLERVETEGGERIYPRQRALRQQVALRQQGADGSSDAEEMVAIGLETRVRSAAQGT